MCNTATTQISTKPEWLTANVESSLPISSNAYLPTSSQETLPPFPLGKRPKLWELETELHCSVIGTCVPVQVLRKIYKRVQGTSAQKLTDYQIHSLFVQAAAEPHDGIRLTQKYLERTYKQTIQQFNQTETPQELAQLWGEAIASGKVAGAYWALLTHAYANEALIKQAFCEVHMLSHLAGRQEQSAQRRSQSLQRKYDDQQQSVKNYQSKIQILQTERNQLAHKLERTQMELCSQSQALQLMQQDFAQLRQQSELITLRKQSLKLEQQLTHISERYQAEQAAKEALVAENTELREALALLQQECAEQTIPYEQKTKTCEQPNLDLCGRCILYVGGHIGTQVHFQQLVEQCNGSYLYHDGGQEDGRQRLPVLLAQADAVVCPLSCVSHRAVFEIKALRKRASKPVIMLRSASLTAFNEALYDLAQRS